MWWAQVIMSLDYKLVIVHFHGAISIWNEEWIFCVRLGHVVFAEVLRNYVCGKRLFNFKAEVIWDSVFEREIVKTDGPLWLTVIDRHQLRLVNSDWAWNDCEGSLDLFSTRLEQLVIEGKTIVLGKVTQKLKIGLETCRSLIADELLLVCLNCLHADVGTQAVEVVVWDPDHLTDEMCLRNLFTERLDE